MGKNEKFISVIIPNFNGEKIISNCINYVFNQNYSNYEVLIIDDFSTDNSLEVISEYKNLNIITNSKNLGFAASCNRGVVECKGDIVLFLNSDAFLEDTNIFSEVNNKFNSNQNLNILGFNQTNSEGKTEFIGSELDIFFSINSYDYKTVKEILMVGGACFATRKHVYQELGGMDADYYLYVEETDYMYRSLKSGYDTEVSDKKVVHIGGHSTKNEYVNTTNSSKLFLRERNSMISILKNFDLLTLTLVIPLLILHNLLEIIFFTISLKVGYLVKYIDIYIYLIINFNNIILKRKKCFKKFKYSDFKFINDKKILLTSFKILFIFKNGIPIFK